MATTAPARGTGRQYRRAECAARAFGGGPDISTGQREIPESRDPAARESVRVNRVMSRHSADAVKAWPAMDASVIGSAARFWSFDPFSSPRWFRSV